MKVLFIGSKKGKSLHSFLTLKKIHKTADFIDPYDSFYFANFLRASFFHVTPKIFAPIIDHYVLSKTNKKTYDLIFVRNGEFVGKSLLMELKKITKKTVVYCNDNPFVKRDKQRWKLSLPAFKYYDLCVFQDQSRINLSKKLGIKKTLLIGPAYQKNVHCRQKISIREKKKYNSDVIFIGTWFKERGEFFKKLISKGLPLKIYGGSRWKKDLNYDYLKSRIILGYVKHPLYSKLLQSAKIALCFPSQGNLDEITSRSIEIPAIGTLLCATRNKTHKKTFIENKEAIFFKDVNECYKKCMDLLMDDRKRKKIAHRGHIKVTKILKLDNETLLRKVVNKVFEKKNYL